MHFAWGLTDCVKGKWGGGVGGEAPHTLMTSKPIFRGHGPKSFSAYGPKNLNPALPETPDILLITKTTADRILYQILDITFHPL